jgi:RNA polymerase sigma-70 factor (ECF subfamily)
MADTLTVAVSRPDARPGIDFEALYRSSRDDVYAYVAGLLRDRSAAEDVTATAFERAYRRRSSFSARRGSPRAWLFGIARNAALDELRRRRRIAPLEAEPAQDAAHEGASAEDAADLALRRRAVREAIGELEPRERDLIALKFFGGLSNSELAQVLRISESNAGTVVHRTVQKLRRACHVPA